MKSGSMASTLPTARYWQRWDGLEKQEHPMGRPKKDKPQEEMPEAKPFFEWPDVTDRELNEALTLIKHGFDPVAANSLMTYFYERMREGWDYNEQILIDYLLHAFGKIIDHGWSADHAFGFKLTRGRYARDSTIVRDLVGTAYMILLMRRGLTYLKASEEAANLLFPDDKGDKTIQAAYSKYKDTLGIFPDEILMEMLPPGTPIISRDMIS
jgi:hypothetical protein